MNKKAILEEASAPDALATPAIDGTSARARAELLASLTTRIHRLFFSGKRSAKLRYVGDSSRFSLERVGILAPTDPSFSFVEHLLFRPDNDMDLIGSRRGFFRPLLRSEAMGPFAALGEQMDAVLDTHAKLE